MFFCRLALQGCLSVRWFIWQIYTELLLYVRLRAKHWYTEMNQTQVLQSKTLAASGGGRRVNYRLHVLPNTWSLSLFVFLSIYVLFSMLCLLLSLLLPHVLPSSLLPYISVLHPPALPTDLVFISIGHSVTFCPSQFLPPTAIFQGPFWRLQSLWSSGQFSSTWTLWYDWGWHGNNSKSSRASVKAWGLESGVGVGV